MALEPQQPGDWWTQNAPPNDSQPMPYGSMGTPGFENGGITGGTAYTDWLRHEKGLPPLSAADLQPIPGQGGTPANVNIEQIKALVGNDYSTEHLKQILPQLQALGVEVQNQQRGDLRPRFLLPGGEQWDFGPGGWINSGHGVQPGFGAGSAGGGASGGLLGNMGGALDTLRNTPGYQFALGQGIQGIERSAFARGGGLTGGVLKAIQQYGTGLADQTYGAQYQRYLDLAKLGYPQQPS